MSGRAFPAVGALTSAVRSGAAAPVVLSSTNAAALRIVPMEALREHAVDVPASPEGLQG